MEKKIKILHVCTIIAIIIFCITQCWWLYTRYDYIWQNYNEELYQSILGIMQEDFENRRISGERNNIDFVCFIFSLCKILESYTKSVS